MLLDKLRPVLPMLTISKMSKEDIGILAMMCRFSEPVVKTGGIFIKQTYAYYVPRDEKDFDLVIKTFAKYGIKMEVHYSRIVNTLGENVLRTNYALYKNPYELTKTIENISQEYINLFTPQFRQLRLELNKRINELQGIKNK